MIDIITIASIIVSVGAIAFSIFTVVQTRNSTYKEYIERSRTKSAKLRPRSLQKREKENRIIITYSTKKEAMSAVTEIISVKFNRKSNKLIIKNLPKQVKVTDSDFEPIQIKTTE